ncbi:thiamine-phosphate pyrophosphorylase [Mucilaginibacter gossypiicola]|uniref:Thiamine-phosphate pyrophosphorylase n=1 Tax=Mucilaginibacter gossypiicola TaxID=551995 RepID=A0A1H8BNT7_9SPHI|nr:thiamine phosphate synthase [Mucilaginibacter gossypiicola]SEM83794.1 thiamine-phosphate pyrophosphorylase [Mucilaginibacter gossypiicola]
MELIVISAPDVVANEAPIINRLFGAGLRRFHLRKPGWNIGRCIDLLAQIDRSYHHAIVCHQHHRLVKVFGMNYLHFTENDRIKTDQSELLAMVNEGYRLSTSIHDVSAMPMLQHFDYTFLSPVFSSISKPGYRSILPADFCLDKSMPLPKVFALGGIDESNLEQVKEMNFDGAAVLGSIWQDPEQAVSNFINIKKVTEQLNS